MPRGSTGEIEAVTTSWCCRRILASESYGLSYIFLTLSIIQEYPNINDLRIDSLLMSQLESTPFTRRKSVPSASVLRGQGEQDGGRPVRLPPVLHQDPKR